MGFIVSRYSLARGAVDDLPGNSSIITTIIYFFIIKHQYQITVLTRYVIIPAHMVEAQ